MLGGYTPRFFHGTGQTMSYTDLRISGIGSTFYALKHGTVKNAIVDKDRPSLTKIKNQHEPGQIVSYKPENHRFRLQMLRPETWDYQKRNCRQRQTKFRQS